MAPNGQQQPLILLREELDLNNFETFTESNEETKEKTYWVKGPTIVSEVKNKNGRTYQKDIVEREVARFADVIKEGRAAGELGHPNTPEINLDRISHYIRELKQDGNIWIGKSQVASTPCGTITKALINDGYKLGISTRGLGTVKEGVVGNDFKLITADLVSDPSGPGCFVESIIESKRWIIDETGKIKEVEIEKVEEAYDDLEKDLKVLPKKQDEIERHMMEAIDKFIRAIKEKA